jgi:PleD family two-component response regulator
VCQGRKRVDREELARRDAQVVDESSTHPESSGRRLASGTRPRVARVLIVYDGPLVSEALRSALSSELEVKLLADARQALASMWRGDWYDVVLCKLTMPRLSGVELRKRVHASSPELAERFVFIDEPVDVPSVCDLVRRLALPGEVSDDADTAVASR